jgi:electron transfer flavoprotein beta subunit
MDITVCAKQIPGPDAVAALDPATGRLVREQPFVLDEADSVGVELALQLAQASGGGAVSVLSMAPANSTDGLRTALAMGADRSVVVSDDALAGSDALSTAKVLARAIGRLGTSLVIAATESSDGYTGAMPVQLAELLGWPAVTFATAVELREGEIWATRQTSSGDEQVRCALPAVVTVTAGAIEPRYPTLRGIMSARQKPVEVLALSDLGIDEAEVGPSGARQRVVDFDAIAARAQGRVVTDSGGDAHLVILEQLREWRVI